MRTIQDCMNRRWIAETALLFVILATNSVLADKPDTKDTDAFSHNLQLFAHYNCQFGYALSEWGRQSANRETLRKRLGGFLGNAWQQTVAQLWINEGKKSDIVPSASEVLLWTMEYQRSICIADFQRWTNSVISDADFFGRMTNTQCDTYLRLEAIKKHHSQTKSK